MYTRKVARSQAALETAPAVLLNAVPKRPSPLASVVPDELGAGRTVAQVLLEAGHRDGIHLIGAGPQPSGSRRKESRRERLSG